MSSTPEVPFSAKVHESVDENSHPVTTIYCHGRLVSRHTDEFKQLVRPLIANGGRILLNFSDLAYIDSSGLGAVVQLKVSSMNRANCSLELIDLSPRVKQLLSMANLVELFTIKPYPGVGSAFTYQEAALHPKDDD